MQFDTMSDRNCINCNVRMSRMRRHSLADESEALVNTVRLWTYPRDITPADHICHACWQLASHSADNVSRRQTGHRHVCVVCGRSILRISRHRVLIEGATAQQITVSAVISHWIQPQELTSEDEVCVPCWLRARRTRLPSSPLQPFIQHQNSSDDGDQVLNLTCAVCGHSLSSMIPANEQQNRDNIALLLEHQQRSSMNEVCGACWELAQQILGSPETVRPQHRQQLVTLPNMRRAAESTRHCIFQECLNNERHSIPEETRRQVLTQFQYFIPRGARICTHHLQEARFENLYTAEYSLDTFSTNYIEEIIFMLMEGLNNINYENIQNYPENQVQYFIGITKQQHQQILEATPRLRNMHRGSFALTALLCKLRTGDSGDRLSCLFQVPRRTLETLINTARNILLNDYVPQYIGFTHLRREQVIRQTSYIAEHIFGEPDAPFEQKPAITLADATYIYTQKSSNYLFQKDTYSLHKYRNLVKPFIICTSNL